MRVVVSDKNEPGNWYKDGVLLVPGETIIIEVNLSFTLTQEIEYGF